MTVKAVRKHKILNKGGWLIQSSAFARGQGLFLSLALAVALLVILPIIFLVVLALGANEDSFPHILKNILPRTGPTTMILLSETGILTAFMGFFSAWLVSFYEFPGRSLLSWAIMLPLAVPTYLSAYGFVEFFSFTGPVQSIIREVGGYHSIRQYYFPDIRSQTGAAIILSFVLYPYVYMAVRAVFHFQGQRIVESARSLGASRTKILFHILIPMARPAITLGVGLVLMEAINDIGAMEYLGVETLTFSIFSIWLNQNDMAGAAQLALFLLVMVFFLIAIERRAQKNRRFYDEHSNFILSNYRHERLSGWRGIMVSSLVAIPVLLGFGIPFFIMAEYAWNYLDEGLNIKLVEALLTSVFFATISAMVTVCLAIIMTYGVWISSNRVIALTVRLASIGYAVPGTIIALGIFLPLAMFDNLLDRFAMWAIGLSTGLLITGSGAIMVFAYTVRFMAMAEGTIDNGLRRISPNIARASRSLGKTSLETFRLTLLPILRPTMGIAFLLVFIDSIKELSATITLRPFGVNTLSTYIYDFASRSRVEETGMASLIIIFAGIIPAILVMRRTLETGIKLSNIR